MSKQITLPIGKIYSIGTMITGMCTAGLVDNALKNTECSSKAVKEIGRYGANCLIGGAFAIKAVEYWFDKDLDVKINLPSLPKRKKKESNEATEESTQDDSSSSTPVELHGRDRTKAINRMNRAIDLWQTIVKDATAIKDGGQVTSNIHEDIKEFNKIMRKLAKRTDCCLVVIPEIPSDGLPGLIDAQDVDRVLNMNDLVARSIKECFDVLFADEVNHDIIDQCEDDDRTDDLEQAENIMRGYADELDDDDLELSVSKTVEEVEEIETNKFLNSIRNYFTEKNMNFDEVVGISDERAQEIMDRLRAGEISAVEACDLMVASIVDNEDDEPNYITNPGEVETINPDDLNPSTSEKKNKKDK